MATIIDSLIIQLGLDSKDVESKAPGVRAKLSDLEKHATKTEKGVKGIGKASKDTASELTVLSGKLGSFLAVIGGTVAVREFVKDTIDTNTQLYFLSKNLETSTQKIFAWGAAAQEIGGSKGTIQNFMRNIASMPGELLTGKMPQLLPLFARLGISFREPFDQIMIDLSKRFAGMDRKIAFSFGTAAGIPEDVMNLLLQGPGAVQAAIGRTKGFGPTDKEAASAAELKMKFTDLELLLVKIGYDLLYKITPYLNKFLDLLLKIGAWAQRHENIVAIIAGIVAALAGFVALVGIIGAVTVAWTALMAALVEAWPVVAVIAVIAALGAAILLLWDDYNVWAQGGKSLFDWTGFTKFVKDAGDAWNYLSGKIKTATEALAGWIKQVAIKLGVDPKMTTPEGQRDAERRAVLAYNKAHPDHPLNSPYYQKLLSEGQSSSDTATGDTGDKIAHSEGFYDKRGVGGKGNIPQEAHNPGDIMYGDFAIAHGATGYVIAKGGIKIATFPDDKTGFAAMNALLATDKYKNLSQDRAIKLWQTGQLMNGITGASSVSSAVPSSTSSSSSSTDNSKTTNIGTVNLHNPTGTLHTTPSMIRGMDWTTLLTQQNSGLQ